MKSLAVLVWLIMIVLSAAKAQYVNVVIGTANEPNEPSIFINPKNPLQMVAGANIDQVFRSSDGGYTWTGDIITSSYGVWGDPVIVADTGGRFYFLHLSVPTWPQWLDRIVCQRSDDGGATWNNGSFMGLNGTRDQDKEWMVVDPVSNTLHTCWTQFDVYGSANPMDSSHIMYSRSTDGGETWSPAVRINSRGGDCIDADNTVEGAVPAVGPGGEVYTSWAGPLGLVFTKSVDGGLTWPNENRIITDIPGGWDFGIPGIYRANGFPVTCCDLSNGPHRGTIYINWSDQRNGESDTDIWLTKSSDGGVSWTSPQRVNNDPAGRQQFFTWMTIDQVTGYLWFVFYDRRQYTNELTDVYLAVSRDGGNTFENFRVSDSPFLPDPGVFFGDYTNVAAYNSVVRPIWTRLDNTSLSVVTAIVDSIFTGLIPEKIRSIPFSIDQNYPNPVRALTSFSYKVYKPSTITLKIYDLFGNEVASILNDESRQPGKYVERLDSRNYHMAPGLYYFSMVSGDHCIKRKMIVE